MKIFNRGKKLSIMLWIISAVFTDHLFFLKSHWYECSNKESDFLYIPEETAGPEAGS